MNTPAQAGASPSPRKTSWLSRGKNRGARQRAAVGTPVSGSRASPVATATPIDYKYGDEEEDVDTADGFERLHSSELASLAFTMWKGLPVRGYRRGLSRKLHKNAFQGETAVQWMLANYGLDDRDGSRTQATRYGQQLVNAGYINRTTVKVGVKGWLGGHRRHSNVFEDSQELYKFNPVAISRTHVSVAVIRAGGLLGKSKSSCDPVCYLKLGKEQVNHTKVIQRTCDPVWNELFVFGVKDLDSQHLEVSVHDCGAVGGLVFLGCVQIPLRSIVERAQVGRAPVRGHTSSLSDVFFSATETSPKNDSRGPLEGRTISAAQAAASSGTGVPMGVANSHSFAGNYKKYFSEERIGLYKLQPGVQGKRSKQSKVNGFIELGVRIETEDDTEQKRRRASTDEDARGASRTYSINVHILRVRNTKEVGIMNLGNMTPLLRWLNRVEVSIDKKKRYTNYAPKKTGPTFNEVVTIELDEEEMRRSNAVSVSVIQCGQLKDVGDSIGEVVIPLALVKEGKQRPSWHPLMVVAGGTERKKGIPKENGEIKISCWWEATMQLNLLGEEVDADVVATDKNYSAPQVEALQEPMLQCTVDAPLAYLTRGIWGNNDFLRSYYLNKMKYYNLEIQDWNLVTNDEENVRAPLSTEGSDEEEHQNCKKVRTLLYMMPANGFVGALQGLLTQQILHSSGKATVVKYASKTPGAPYGGTFEAWQMYKLEWAGPRKTKITMSQETHWLGDKPWVWVNIEGAVRSGSRDAAEKFVGHLRENLGLEGNPGDQSGGTSRNDERLKKRWVFLRWTLLLFFFLFAMANMWTNFEKLEEEGAASESDEVTQRPLYADVELTQTDEKMTSAAVDSRDAQIEL